MGCMLSHIDLLRQINESEFMIIEDDIKVIGSINDMNKAISQLPDNWDLLYLGAELNQPITRFSDNLFILKNATVTHAIMYNNQNGVVDYIIDKHEYIIDGLSSIGLKAVSLDTQSLIELYYNTYNPDIYDQQKIVDINKLDIE